LRQPITGAAELYAKPSDRWEVNEVAKLLPEVAAGLAAVLSDSSNSKADDAAVSLPEILTSEFD
jgi:hypothetical protein